MKKSITSCGVIKTYRCALPVKHAIHSRSCMICLIESMNWLRLMFTQMQTLILLPDWSKSKLKLPGNWEENVSMNIVISFRSKYQIHYSSRKVLRDARSLSRKESKAAWCKAIRTIRNTIIISSTKTCSERTCYSRQRKPGYAWSATNISLEKPSSPWRIISLTIGWSPKRWRTKSNGRLGGYSLK